MCGVCSIIHHLTGTFVVAFVRRALVLPVRQTCTPFLQNPGSFPPLDRRPSALVRTLSTSYPTIRR